MKREYEIGLIINPETADEEAEKIKTSITDILKKGKGTIENIDEWGRKNLAYPIEKHKEGIYVFIKTMAPGDVIAAIERRLKLNEKVMRFIVIRLDDKFRKTNKLEKKWKRIEKFSKKPGGDMERDRSSERPPRQARPVVEKAEAGKPETKVTEAKTEVKETPVEKKVEEKVEVTETKPAVKETPIEKKVEEKVEVTETKPAVKETPVKKKVDEKVEKEVVEKVVKEIEVKEEKKADPKKEKEDTVEKETVKKTVKKEKKEEKEVKEEKVEAAEEKPVKPKKAPAKKSTKKTEEKVEEEVENAETK